MAPGCWFLVWICCLQLLLAAGAEEQRGDDGCSPKMCGNVNISSPFWLTYWDEPQAPCGSSDFEVTCDNSTTPILRNAVSIEQAFAIKNIFYKESSLRVVDLYAQNTSEVCLGRNWNFSVKVDRPFNISPSNLNIALYNCTTAAMADARHDPALVEMGACGIKSSVFVRGAGGRYDANRSYAGYYRHGCNATIVPVLGVSGVANASEYKQLISHGFLLTWDLPHPPLPVDPNSTGDLDNPNKKGKKIGIGLGAGSGGMLMGFFAFFIWYKHKKRKQARTSSELMRSGSSMSYSKDLELGGFPHIFTFEELEEATDGFSASRELGVSGTSTRRGNRLELQAS